MTSTTWLRNREALVLAAAVAASACVGDMEVQPGADAGPDTGRTTEVDAGGGDVEQESVGDAGPVACRGTDPVLEREAAPTRERAPRGDLDPVFDDVAHEFDVPAALLKSVAYAETRFTMVSGHREFEGMEPAYGLMALRGDRLVRGAELAGVPAERARTDERDSIRAAAALLDAHAADLGVDRDELGAWGPAIAEASGLDDAAAADQYVARIFSILREGLVAKTDTGELRATLMPESSVPEPPQDAVAAAAAPDYADAVWRPSPNYSSRPSGSRGDVSMVIIHTCEGTYSGCWSWLRNDSAGASAHYVVSESGHETTQLVRERDRAWHIAADYSCDRNSGVDCGRNGYSSNDFTVGIEHGGFASQSSFPAGQIDASARLACDISRDHDVPRDRYHFVGHGQLQPWNRTDPGPNWPWNDYIERVRSHCGGGSGLIIDSNNDNNDTSRARIEVSDAWTSSDLTAGYYGTGYWHNATGQTCDPAVFWFHLDEPATKTIDGWWTAGANRSSQAPFTAYDADGNKLGTAHANQQEGGQQWVEIGTWEFSAGWNQVVLSRQTDGDVVIADALRVR